MEELEREAGDGGTEWLFCSCRQHQGRMTSVGTELIPASSPSSRHSYSQKRLSVATTYRRRKPEFRRQVWCPG